MDLLWQINPWEMLSGLMVTTFLMLLNASIVVVASMVMFPLIDLAFKKKAKPAPAQVNLGTIMTGYSHTTGSFQGHLGWLRHRSSCGQHHDGLTAHAQPPVFKQNQCNTYEPLVPATAAL